jgi:hypothetical protein
MSVERECYGCGLPIPAGERAIQATTGNAWKHFECWYDGTPFPRDRETGARQRIRGWVGLVGGWRPLAGGHR